METQEKIINMLAVLTQKVDSLSRELFEVRAAQS